MNLPLQRPLQKNLLAFSLIEMSIVLMVIGIIAAAVFKGQELLENAKVRSVVQDFQHYALSVSMYQDTYQSLPGDDPKANEHFQGVQPGNGDGKFSGDEANQFWLHLNKASLLGSARPPRSKFGGRYTVVSDLAGLPGNWMMLAKEDGSGLLTPKQAQAIKNKFDHGDNATNPSQGQLIIKDGNGATGRCVQEDRLKLEITAPECVVYYKF